MYSIHGGQVATISLACNASSCSTFGGILFQRFISRFDPVSSTDGLRLVCLTLQDSTVTCNVSSDNWLKIILLPKWTGLIDTGQTNKRTHTLPHCTHDRWWLKYLAGWPPNKIIHANEQLTQTTYHFWRVIKFLLQLQLADQRRTLYYNSRGSKQLQTQGPILCSYGT